MLNAHFYPSSIVHESRIERETTALNGSKVFDRVAIIGVQTGDLPSREVLLDGRVILRFPRLAEHGTSLFAKVIKTRSWSVRVARYFASEHDLACVSCHSLAILPLCAQLARKHGARLSYEPHELETETAYCRGLRRWLMRRLEAKWIRSVDSVIVVSSEIARWYEARYGINVVRVVRNVPAAPSSIQTVNLRSQLKLKPQDRLFVYSGGLFAGRRVEQFLRIFSQLRADIHLLFIGFGPRAPLVHTAASRCPNIHYLPAVPASEVIAHLRGADVGLSGVENISLSYYFSLPNKLFEYMHAGLGSIVPNYPEMRCLIEETGAGWVARDDSDAAWRELILSIDSDEIAKVRINAAAAAARYTAAGEMATLLQAYGELGFPPYRVR